MNHARHALLLKRRAGCALVPIVRLAEKNHIALLLQLTDDTRHDFDGKAVAKNHAGSGRQVGSVGAKVSSGNVMNIAQRRDGIDLLSIVASEIFPFWRSTSGSRDRHPACFATSMMLTFFKITP